MTAIDTSAAPLSARSDIHPGRLFVASCMSLISTAVTFAVIGDIMLALKEQFILTNEQVGQIAGAATWGFTLSIFVLGPLCDALGMKNLMRFAFLCHFVGVLMMILARDYWMLFFGALIISLGNGTVEAACNPLIATIYPDQKTRKLNQFHMWFPGGIVIGGLICYLFTHVHLNWQYKLATILIPTVIYGILFLGQRFPATERLQSGISFGGMFKETFTRPLFIVLFFCMMITASLELGPNRWVSSVLQAGGMPGILVLVYISALMAILRFFAGPVVHKFSNTGVLLASAILAGAGLLLLSYSGGSPGMAFGAATVFAVGVCYFWPTMIGTAAERVPKGGALALAILGGTGMLIVGVVTTPWMGSVADRYLHQHLVSEQAKTIDVLKEVSATYPTLAASAPNAVDQQEISAAVDDVNSVLTKAATGTLPEGPTANALRGAVKYKPDGDTPAAKAGKDAADLLGPADNYGGLMSFRYVAPFALVLVVVFGILFIRDLSRGGYKPEKISATEIGMGAPAPVE